MRPQDVTYVKAATEARELKRISYHTLMSRGKEEQVKHMWVSLKGVKDIGTGQSGGRGKKR